MWSCDMLCGVRRSRTGKVCTYPDRKTGAVSVQKIQKPHSGLYQTGIPEAVPGTGILPGSEYRKDFAYGEQDLRPSE